PDGVIAEDAAGKTHDSEAGADRILAASRLWSRIASADSLAVGGFAYHPDRDPQGAWSGLPALLFRVPALAVMRRRGRTFVVAATREAEDLLDLAASPVRAPAARLSPAPRPSCSSAVRAAMRSRSRWRARSRAAATTRRTNASPRSSARARRTSPSIAWSHSSWSKRSVLSQRRSPPASPRWR